jgi:hypothetical protein
MHCLGKDPIADAPLQALRRPQVDAAAEHILQTALELQKSKQPDGFVELHQQVHVAVLSCFVARDRSKEGEVSHAEAHVQSFLLGSKRREDFLPAHAVMILLGRRPPGRIEEAQIPDQLDIELGYCYHSTAAMADDELLHENPRASKGRPGTRPPHVWLDRNGERISTLDLFGRSWVLLAGQGAEAWGRAAHTAAEHLSLRLDVQRMGTAGLADSDGVCGGAYCLGDDGVVLVRPVGFVAWRATDAADASAETVTRVLSGLISRRA